MQQIGKVIKTYDNKAVVQVKRSGACGEVCGSCAGCSFSERRITVNNTIGAAKGNIVKLETPDGAVISGAFIVYILPVILMIISYLLCDMFFTANISAAISLFSLLAYFLLFRKIHTFSDGKVSISKIIY